MARPLAAALGFTIALGLGFVAALPAAPVRAQAATAELTVAPDRITVGDPLTLTLHVRHPAGTQVVVPRLGPRWGPLELRAQSPLTTTGRDGGAVSRSVIAGQLFEPGTHATPPLTLTLVAAGGATTPLPVAPVSLSVASVLVDAEAAPRDIKGPATLPPPPRWPRWLALAFGALTAVGGLGWLWRRRADEPVPVVSRQPARPARSPEETALAALDGLARDDLPAAGRFKEHYTRLADTLRGYLEARCDVPAPDQTTAETRRALARADVPDDAGRSIVSLLEESDLVKFAKVTPPAALARRRVDDARALVRRMAPVTEQAPPDPDERPAAVVDATPIEPNASSVADASPGTPTPQADDPSADDEGPT